LKIKRTTKSNVLSGSC